MIFSILFSQVTFGVLGPIPTRAFDDDADAALLAAGTMHSAAETAATTAGKVAIVAAIVAALGAGASVLSSDNMNSVMDDAEKRYHINTSSVQNMSETMNSSANKEMAPQMNLLFNPTDPKNGKEITAQAIPLYFSSQPEDLYFTWYLKRKGCDLENNLNPNSKDARVLDKIALCDSDGFRDINGRADITVNDWKVQAMRRIANGGFVGDQVNYENNSTDDDGYKAQHGGNKSTSGYCYMHDFDSGADYELIQSGGDIVYMHTLYADGTVAPAPYENTTPTPYIFSDYKYFHTLYEDGSSASVPYENYVSTPYISNRYVHTLNTNGTPATIPYENNDSTPYGPADIVTHVVDNVTQKYLKFPPVDTVTQRNKSAGDGCFHFFPVSSADDTGNGSFGVNEERFWHTDPKDPSTAQNGNKDEANVVGLGQDKFTWNYALGDEVGVVIEGLSMNPTKHDDSSMKVMWAFSKNKCSPSAGTLGGSVAGSSYNGGVATIPTVSMSSNVLDTCLENNLVDPTQGDQASKFEIQLAASPENPSIDSFSKEQTDNRGSMLKIQSSFVNSATKESDVSYDWRIYGNQKQSAVIDDAWENITEGLTSAHAVSSVVGNDLSALKINLNIDKDTKVNGQNFFDRYFKNDVGYFRINATATENFDVGKRRVGRSSIVVKIIRAKAQIQTHAVTVNKDWKLEFAPAIPAKDTGLLCEDSTEDRSVCPVVKGQIVGLGFDAAALGLQASSGADITWNINNKPFKCSDTVSMDAGCANGEKNFFPVTGDVGEIYTVTMTANNTLSGKSVTLTRIFRVVEPSLLIVSADATNVWPKLLGQYVDSNSNTTDNYSKDVFESFSGKKFSFKGLFYPSSLKNNASVSWSVNGVSAQPDNQGLLTIDDAVQSQQAGSVYTVSLQGTHTPSPGIKKALSDIWGVSIADVTETELSRSIQVEMVQGNDGLAQGPLNSSKKFFASIIAYVPSSVIFFFRLVMTVGLILFTLGIVFAYVPEKRKLT